MKKRKVDSSSDRVIAHIDLDCFYVQVERSINKSLMGKPVGVVQYNPFGDLKSYAPEDNRLMSSGSLIAVSYEARARGVKRSMRGGEAKKVCPDMLLVQVPTSHGKADLTIYRDASAQILTVLCNKYPSCIVERASIDEVYIDVTAEASRYLETVDQETFLAEAISTLVAVPSLIAGDDTVEVTMSRRQISKGHSGTEMSANSYSSAATAETTADNSAQQVAVSAWFARPAQQWSTEDKLLLCGALLTNELRKAVFDELGFTCSAGIANNKILAKLSSAMHKPNKQTMAPPCAIPKLMTDLPFNRIQGLGGKLGTAIENIYGDKVRTMGHILAVPQPELVRHFGAETAQWLHAVAQGIDYEPVVDRALPISIGCSKSFRSSNMLTPTQLVDGTVLHWLTELAKELQERLAADTKKNSRIPRNLHAGASVKVSSAGGAKPATEQDAEKAAGEPDGWSGWWADQGFSLSKICPLPLNATPEAMARASLQMLTKAIFEHPKFISAMNVRRNGGAKPESSDAKHGNGTGPSSPLPASASSAPKPAGDTDGDAAAAQEDGSVTWTITGLSMGSTNFQTIEVGAGSIKSFFSKNSSAASSRSVSATTSVAETLADNDREFGIGQASPPAWSAAQSRRTAVTEPDPRNPASPLKRRRITDVFAPAVKDVQVSGRESSAELSAPSDPGSARADKPRTIRDLFNTHASGASCTSSAGPAATTHDQSAIKEVGHEKQRSKNSASVVDISEDDGHLSHEEGAEDEVLILEERSSAPSSSHSSAQPGSLNTTTADIQHWCTTRRSAVGSVSAAPRSSSATKEPGRPGADSSQTHVEPHSQRRVHEPQSMQDIDSAVFLTLPPDIQREIELTMRLRQQQQQGRAALQHAPPSIGSAGPSGKIPTYSKSAEGNRNEPRSDQQRTRNPHEAQSMQEVDSAVFLTLPPDIQREIELTMRLRQQQSKLRAGARPRK